MRAAVIRESDNTVVNVIDLEPGATWAPPAGHFVRFQEDADFGMVWDGVSLVR